ncbi:MAG TPA: hypothetical protein PLU30_17190 [Verrucomicrobiae bacterium]|nr:hypothetical protein [Verrucomicrobiae bacterium]
MNRTQMTTLILWLVAIDMAPAQKWINPSFDAHRLDYRTLGYPDVTEIEADNSPITALLTATNGRVYGATSGKTASFLFLYDRGINKVRPLGRIADARGVYHALAQDSDGTLLIGGGLNMLAPVPLTREFPGGFRAIEKQLWIDVAATHTNYPGGHLYRYDPAKGDAGTRMPGEPCPLEDLGIPVGGDSIYAIAMDANSRHLYGISYPNALFFAWDITKNKCDIIGPVVERRIYSGPERAWRSVPRALHVAPDGRVYTSGDDGRIVFFDIASKKLVRTAMQIPGEYYEAWNYNGYPVLEQWATDAKGNLFGTTSDGYLFQIDVGQGRIANLGKPRLSRRVRAMALGQDERLYMICGELQEMCKLISYDPAGQEGFRDWGVLAVDRSPYYARRAYQFDAMTAGIDGTMFIGESDRRACLFLFLPGGKGFDGGFNPANPR